MNIVVFAEHIRSMPWSLSIWSARIARGLAQRGHEVVLACDGIEDPAVAGPLRLLVRRPRRTLRGADPLGLARWARQVRGQMPGATAVSLTRYVPAELWIPLGLGIVPMLVRSVRTHRPVSAIMEVLHHPWAPQALLAERRARAGRGPRGHHPARLGALTARDGVAALGYASHLDVPAPEESAALRTEVRRLLGIPHSAVVFLTSAVHTDRAGLDAMLGGLALLRGGAAGIDGGGPDRAPVLLVVGRRTHTIRRACDRAGLGDSAEGRVRILGGTGRIDAALAASDAVIAYGARSDRACTGRFVCDALRAGKPVLAGAAAGGADLILSAPGQPRPGMVVPGDTAAAWCECLAAACGGPWRGIAGAQASRIGAGLGMDRLVERVEAMLARTGADRERAGRG